MVERHIISPSAGRMRPKTSESGIFSTKRNRPVSTSMLTRMLVPNPKNAFQSPGVHRVGRLVLDVIDVIAGSYRSRAQSRFACALGRRTKVLPAEHEAEAGHLDPGIAEAHHDPEARHPASWQGPQKPKPKPAKPTSTSRCAVANDVAVPVKV